MNAVSNMVSISARAASPAKPIKRAARPRPWVFIIDNPKKYVLVAVLGATALVLAGALASDLLRTPRSLACEAPPITSADNSHRDPTQPAPAPLKD